MRRLWAVARKVPGSREVVVSGIIVTGVFSLANEYVSTSIHSTAIGMTHFEVLVRYTMDISIGKDVLESCPV